MSDILECCDLTIEINDGEELSVEINDSEEITFELLEGGKGDQGPIGPVGPEGKGPYEYVVENGYNGMEADFKNSFVGLVSTTQDVEELMSLVPVIRDKEFIYTQITASSAWHIIHNLGKNPSVSIVDSAGSLVVGDIDYLNSSELIIYFKAPFGGTAYLN